MKTITIKVPPEWLDKIDAWATGQSIPVSRSDLIRTAVEKYVDERPVEDEAKSNKERKPRGKAPQAEAAAVTP